MSYIYVEPNSKPWFIPLWLAKKFRDGSREKPFLYTEDALSSWESGGEPIIIKPDEMPPKTDNVTTQGQYITHEYHIGDKHFTQSYDCYSIFAARQLAIILRGS